MKHNISLIIKLINNHGIFKTCYLLIKMIAFKILDLFFYKKNKIKVESLVKGKRVIVFSKAIEWNNMFQRIQQMALEFSKCKDTVVIYVERCSTHDFFANLKKINDNLICYSFRHYEKLNELLSGSSETVLYLTNLFEFETNISIKYDKMVYEFVDELELFFDDIEVAEKYHKKALELANVSVATATRLYEQIKPYANKAILSPNAVDYDFFSNAKNQPIATDIKDIIPKYDIVLGYYGALASWFDFEVICKVANMKPNWLFILIGTRFDDTMDKYNLSKYQNIRFLGAKPYATLPNYISGIDILTIPFLVNNITKSTSPVKLFEYMASKTPILTSMLPECKKYDSVYSYQNADDFIETTQLLYKKKDTPEYISLLEKEAKENTWSARVKQVLDALE